MRLSRRTNIIILWITSIGLLVGMVITFTPTLGALTGSQASTSAPALIVNGETLRDLDVAQVRQSSPIYNVVSEGPVAADLDLLLKDTLIRAEVVRQAAARQRVGNGDVRSEVEAFRVANGVDGSRNDEAYLRLIGGAGYTDQTFREYVRQQLQIRAYQDEVTDGVTVSEEEVRSFYESNLDAYQTDARVLARQIVAPSNEVASEARDRALAGEDFAVLAQELSLERADVGGAVGGDEPQPVGRPAFPTNVATAVFSRSTPGLTPVVENAGSFYVVQVLEVIAPEARPFDDVRGEVEEDALAAKQQAALDDALAVLLADAVVEIPEGSILPEGDAIVAVVGSHEIRASELARATYTNPQIQQALSPQTASLIADFFKPSILEQLVDGALAVQGAKALDATFFGTDDLIAQSALNYVARDAEATPADLEAYYQANLDRYTVPASADVLRVDFETAETAEAYREQILGGADPTEAAEALEAVVEDLGVVTRGQLRSELDISLFDTEAYEPLPGGVREVSDVLVLTAPVETPAEEDATSEPSPLVSVDPEAYVVLVAVREAESVLLLDEVRSDVEARVLANERQALQRAWLDGLRDEIEVDMRYAPALGASDDASDEALVDDDSVDEASSEADGDSEATDDADDDQDAPAEDAGN